MVLFGIARQKIFLFMCPKFLLFVYGESADYLESFAILGWLIINHLVTENQCAVAIFGWLIINHLVTKNQCAVAIFGWLIINHLVTKNQCAVAIFGWLIINHLVIKNQCAVAIFEWLIINHLVIKNQCAVQLTFSWVDKNFLIHTKINYFATDFQTCELGF